MSTNIYFYKVVPAEYSMVDGYVDLDNLGYDNSWYREGSDVPAWVPANAEKVSFQNSKLDMFAVGLEMFGKKPTSISMNSYNLDEHYFNFPDGSRELVYRDELEPYYEIEHFDGWIFGRELIGEFESYRIENYRELGLDEARIDEVFAEKLLRDYIQENLEDLDDDYSGGYYMRPVYVLTRVMLAAKDGDCIVCEVG